MEDDDEAVEGSDRVTIPRFVVPSVAADAAVNMAAEQHRWLRPIVVSIRVQVMPSSLAQQTTLVHLNRVAIVGVLRL